MREQVSADLSLQTEECREPGLEMTLARREKQGKTINLGLNELLESGQTHCISTQMHEQCTTVEARSGLSAFCCSTLEASCLLRAFSGGQAWTKAGRKADSVVQFPPGSHSISTLHNKKQRTRDGLF